MHPHEQATAWLAAAGIPLADTEPKLAIDAAARTAMRLRLGEGDSPLVAIGIGSSEPYKQWGAERFATLARRLRAAGWTRLVLVGGPSEQGLAADINARAGEPLETAIGWDIAELAALLADAAFYVGNDTGAMNLAAAVGTVAYGLFGATPPLHHSKLFVAILPPNGQPDHATGMARISVDAVLAELPSP
jgi:heptosyltransferase-2